MITPIPFTGCQSQPSLQSENRISNETPQNPLIRYEFSSGELTRLCDAAIQSTTSQLNQINKTNPLFSFEKIVSDFSDTTSALTFMSYVSTNETTSKEASECEQKVRQFAVTIYTRKDLYHIIRGQKTSTPSEERLLNETLKAFEENGLKLPDARLEQVRKLKKKLATIESKFTTNLNQDNSTVEFSLEELEGVPKNLIDNLPRSAEGKYIVGVKRPQRVMILENAIQGESRRKMLYAVENRAAKENAPLLEEAILLRQKIAKVLGYKTWADYRVHNRMARDSKAVVGFLTEFKKKIASRNKADLAALLKLKKTLDPEAKILNPWDISYLAYQLKKRDYNLDDQLIREYFPADVVLDGLFKAYSQLLGVEFIEEKNAKTWANGVKVFRIVESLSSKSGRKGDLIGYFYTDFLPRKGKYGQAAAFTLIGGRALDDGKYSHPVSSIVANFSAAEPGKPVLLTHDEVRILFHEFGHVMHQTLTRAPYASLSGMNVDHDFVEAPSQMLENWVYSPEVLSLISGHYKNHSEKLPAPLLEKIKEARDFNQGYLYTEQLVYGLLDMIFHIKTGKVNSAQTYSKLFKELMGIPAIEGTHSPSSFSHLMGGYDAGYYGYLWSEVYAADMFTRFEKERLLNPLVGYQYRKTILEQGKMIDAYDLIQEFLGRRPDNRAFYKKLRVKEGSPLPGN